jgi:hypothetical protein
MGSYFTPHYIERYKMATADDKKTDYVDTGVRIVKDIGGKLLSLKSMQNLDLFRIGKPTGFHKAVDPDSRIKYYMESKMNVIDIIPCSYTIPLGKSVEIENNDKVLTPLKGLTPAIGYEQAVKAYQDVCTVYGLDGKYAGLRLYITDETTSTDQFDVSYSDNMIEGQVNALSDMGRQFKNIMRSVSSQYDTVAAEYGQKVGGAIGGMAGNLGEMLTDNLQLKEGLSQLGASVGTAIALGQKFSLPKIWSDSNYSPNMNAVIKLVSPYGHPDAIKEFIIQPLMYLLIMASSRTLDGISYGSAPKVTVKAYGVAHYPLAGITGITIMRGGADTSFNIYRQPLSVNVSLSFQPLVSGFAAYEEAGHESSYKDTNLINSDLNNGQAGQRALFPTLGTYIDSLKPIAINQIVTGHNVKGLGSHLENKKDAEIVAYPEGTQESMNETSRQTANQKATETAKGQTYYSRRVEEITGENIFGTFTKTVTTEKIRESKSI